MKLYQFSKNQENNSVQLVEPMDRQDYLKEYIKSAINPYETVSIPKSQIVEFITPGVLSLLFDDPIQQLAIIINRQANLVAYHTRWAKANMALTSKIIAEIMFEQGAAGMEKVGDQYLLNGRGMHLIPVDDIDNEIYVFYNQFEHTLLEQYEKKVLFKAGDNLYHLNTIVRVGTLEMFLRKIVIKE